MIIESKEYDFLRTNEHLGDHIMFLTYGGSHAYGTNIETSDIDIRGCAAESSRNLLTNNRFEQFIDSNTDTIIYGFNKLVSLLTNCNPNTIEMLGCKPEHYFYISPLGQLLLDNKNLFISKRCVQSFGGYATAQLRRLDNKANRVAPQGQQQVHILTSIKKGAYYFAADILNNGLKLYTDSAEKPDMDKDIFADINLNHYCIRDLIEIFSNVNAVVKDYDKLGHRNKQAIEHGKIAKHMMHLVRLYFMCFDMLEKGEIITYREKDRDFLLEIRNGKYLDDNSMPKKEFFELVDELENKFSILSKTSEIPAQPDFKKIEDFTYMVNSEIVKRY